MTHRTAETTEDRERPEREEWLVESVARMETMLRNARNQKVLDPAADRGWAAGCEEQLAKYREQLRRHRAGLPLID
jgi:hypothetical protein